jgi:Xaa-Pro aminopeptidase
MALKVIDRIIRIRECLVEKELDGIFISQAENRYYMSGFNGSAGYLLVNQRDAVLATDFRYTEQARLQAPDYRIFQITGNLSEWFPRLLAEFNMSRLGFEATDVTFTMYRQLGEALSKTESRLQLVSTEGLVESLRAIKEPGEIELISKAARISDEAFENISKRIRTGMTEKEIAWAIERFMREHDSQVLPFEVIVASGANAALPHHKPSERQISPGEPIVIDIGARVDGYCSDLTRTICVGQPEDKFKKIYDIVLGSQLAAIALIKDGMNGNESDSFARTVIKEAGYGDSFGHALGHGVGLAPHEQPRLGPNSTDLLKSGMVFSIEPGIYLVGWGGVRIEDLALMENGKVRLLSGANK